MIRQHTVPLEQRMLMTGDQSGNEEASVTAGNPSPNARNHHTVLSSSPSAPQNTAALIAPSKEHLTGVSPPSAKVVHYTDVRTKALGVKAELEELRRKQLAKNLRQDIGKCIPRLPVRTFMYVALVSSTPSTFSY